MNIVDQIQTSFMLWYYSDRKLSQYVRNGYRRIVMPILRSDYSPAWLLLEFDPRRFIVLDDRKLVYIEISKAGTTSIKTTIGRSYGMEPKYDTATHGQGWHEEIGRLLPPMDGYYKFTFVRNPFSRLVSCYMEKFHYVCRKRSRLYYKAGPYNRLPKTIPFTEFVHMIVKIPDRWADRHIKSQYAILHHRDRLIADWVGHLENIEGDWAELASRFDLEPNIEHRHSTQKQGLYEDYRSFYTERTAGLVYKRYRRDFETFGYSDAYHELLAYINGEGEHG